MSKLLTTAALALVLATPTFAAEVGAGLSADTTLPVVGSSSVKSSSAVETHTHTKQDADGNVISKTEEEHTVSTHSKDADVSTDAGMTVDDEE